MDYKKLYELAEGHKSNNSEKKFKKIIELYGKISKKENNGDFIEVRDILTMISFLLSTIIENFDNLKMSVSQRKELGEYLEAIALALNEPRKRTEDEC